MAEINIAQLPIVPTSDFTDNDHLVVINDGKAQLLPRPTLQSWLSTVIVGEKGDQGISGNDGRDGRDGVNGISATHRWNGTTLTITSASGTSSANLKGENGTNGLNGTNGRNGWSPIYSAVERGQDLVLRIVGWTGGTGSQPTNGQYIGLNGLVNNIDQAVNIKGPQGIQGIQGETGNDGADGQDGATLTSVEYLQDGSLKITKSDSTSLQTTSPPKQTGWQKYKDTTYTQSTPFSLSPQTEVVIPNDGLIVVGALPSTIPTLYTSSTQKINLKDSNGLYTIRVRFKVSPSTESNEFRVSFSKDTTEIPFVQEFSSVARTTPRNLEISTFIHGDSVLVTNGMSIRVMSEKVSSIYDIEFLIGKVV